MMHRSVFIVVCLGVPPGLWRVDVTSAALHRHPHLRERCAPSGLSQVLHAAQAVQRNGDFWISRVQDANFTLRWTLR